MHKEALIIDVLLPFIHERLGYPLDILVEKPSFTNLDNETFYFDVGAKDLDALNEGKYRFKFISAVTDDDLTDFEVKEKYKKIISNADRDNENSFTYAIITNGKRVLVYGIDSSNEGDLKTFLLEETDLDHFEDCGVYQYFVNEREDKKENEEEPIPNKEKTFDIFDNNEKHSIKDILNKVSKSDTANKMIANLKNFENKKLFGFLGLLVVCLIVFYPFVNSVFSNNNPDYTYDEYKKQKKSESNTDNQVRNIKGKDISFLKARNVIEVKPTKDLEKIDITLVTDLEDDAIIKFKIISAEGEVIKYDKVSKRSANVNYSVPANLKHEDILIIAYLPFDIDNAESADILQPSHIINKYGKNGEKRIIDLKSVTVKQVSEDEEYQKYGLTYATAKVDNAAIRKYNKEVKAENDKKKAFLREKDFANLETMVDYLGNMKHVPKGYILKDKVNISDDVNIYPEITYSIDQDELKFQIVTGFKARIWQNLRSVEFYADGNVFSYEAREANVKKSTSGGVTMEWTRFSDKDKRHILENMSLLANSKDSRINFLGDLNYEHDLSQAEKDNLKYMLYIYEVHYDNGKTKPELSWFVSDENKVSFTIEYLQTLPVLYRNSSELFELEKYKTLKEKSLKNPSLWDDKKEEILKEMNSLYKIIPENSGNSFTYVSNLEGEFVYDSDDLRNLPHTRYEFFIDEKDLNKRLVAIIPDYENIDDVYMYVYIKHFLDFATFDKNVIKVKLPFYQVEFLEKIDKNLKYEKFDINKYTR